ncbi:MAG: hypothetical protein IKE01_00725 [Clostridia bacterium]|nr:hypothetical protein [Clostridia bacterium]
MSLYDKIAKNQKCIELVRKIRKKREIINKKKRVKGKYTFIDRKKNYEKLCIILAGYKEFLWEDVFGRIEKYVPDDVDVCIVSSGVFSENLKEIAEKNEWSYLSVKQNKVSLVQNIAINLFEKAKMIYKLDEDIFVTENFFNKLYETYENVEKNSNYRIGYVAPLLPINGYANVIVLKKTGLTEKFEKLFGKPYHDGCGEEPIIMNPDIAKFMWGDQNDELKDIDNLDRIFSKEKFSYSVCPIRFSIGAILFSRNFWEEIGRLYVGPGNNMGKDEEQICEYCMIKSRAMIVSENTIVGHFSYGPQTNEMKKYYQEHREIFRVK